jgi:hypothetical protein
MDGDTSEGGRVGYRRVAVGSFLETCCMWALAVGMLHV